MACLECYRELIVHVHIKDVDDENAWAPLGQGKTPLQQVFQWLESIGFSGWVVIEEESEAVRQDVVKAITANRLYLRSMRY